MPIPPAPRRPSTVLVFSVVLLIAGLGPSWLLAQGNGDSATPPSPTAAATPSLDQRIKEIDELLKEIDSKTLAAADKEEAKSELGKAKNRLAEAQKYQEQIAEYDTKALNEKLATLDQTADALSKERPAPIDGQQPIEQLEARLESANQELNRLKTEIGKLEDTKARSERRLKVQRELADDQATLASTLESLATPAPEDQSADVAEATRRRLEARRESYERKIALAERQLANWELSTRVLSRQRDVLTRRIGLQEDLVERLEVEVNRQRQSAAETRVEEARRGIEVARQLSPEFLLPIAEQNLELAEENLELATQIADAVVAEQEMQAIKKKLAEDYKDTQQKVEAAGGRSDAVGILLRRQRPELNKIRERKARIRQRRQMISETQLEYFQAEDVRQSLETPNVQRVVDRILQNLTDPTSFDRGAHAEQVSQTYERTRETASILTQQYDRYLSVLAASLVEEQALVEVAEEFQLYIQERVLWIRSTSPLWSSEPLAWWESIAWLSTPQNWLEVSSALVMDLLENPIPVGFCALGITVLLLLRRRFRKRLSQAAKRANARSNVAFGWTWMSVIYTILLAAVAPLVVLLVDWRLASSGSSASYVTGLVSALSNSVILIATASTVAALTRKDGLADAHLNWNRDALRKLRLNLTWYLPILIAGIFLSDFFAASAGTRLSDSFGRSTFIIALLATSVFAHRVLRFPQWHATNGDRSRVWILRTWYVIGVILPFVLSILAARGYYYTAQRLSAQIVATFWLGLGLTVIRSAALRWIKLQRKRLLIKQREQRLAEAAGTEGDDENAAGVEGAAVPEIDISELDLGVRKLLHAGVFIAALVGLWLVWVDELPAIGVLREVELWDTTQQFSETVVSDGVERIETTERVVPINLSDVLFAVFIFLFTLFASKHVPSFLEIAILQRLSVAPGERNAITSITRYVIVFAGIVFGFLSIGIGWEKVQWLAAAISLGLGFGLQEIFANFVSGLILLFERPIRIGDIVTVGSVEGRVTRMKIRATTITDWDRRELVVPNREFITSQFINWTLSDPVTRVTIPVGVSYGADTVAAARLLEDIARKNSRVMEEPAPFALFKRFGESTLDIDLRVFLGDRNEWPKLVHELHTTILREFRKAKIEIAFPQRDIHIRTAPATPSFVRELESSERPMPPSETTPRAKG